MVATNSVKERTGNVSAGTSIFAMSVLERPLSKVYLEIDMITTPSGKPVAMAHCNNCTTDLDAWVRLFAELGALTGAQVTKSDLYDALYNEALEGDGDCSGLITFNYYGGEPLAAVEQGRPLFVRLPDSRFTLANFMRSLLFGTMATLKLGMDILTEREGVRLEQIMGHGGFFKTPVVGQRLMAACLGVPVTVMDSAGEGGAWGIALLAAYMCRKTGGGTGETGETAGTGGTLEDFLATVFDGMDGTRLEPDPKDVEGFSAFMERYTAALELERVAASCLK
jgi:sugar (pentulose or hexulose) kinase